MGVLKLLVDVTEFPFSGLSVLAHGFGQGSKVAPATSLMLVNVEGGLQISDKKY